MRLIQYQGMVHSRNDGTSFNVLGIDGCVTPTFACTPKFSQIESNVLPIILIQSSDFLYLSFKEKAKARSFSIMFRSSSHLERTISYLSDRVPMYSSWVIPNFSLSFLSFSSRCFCLPSNKSSTADFAADATSALNFSTSMLSVGCEPILLDNELSAFMQVCNLSCNSSRVSIASSFKGTGFLFAIIICVLVCTFSCPCHHRQNVTNHHLRQLTKLHEVEALTQQPLLQHQTCQ